VSFQVAVQSSWLPTLRYLRRQRLLSLSPASLSQHGSPHGHSSGPNYTLHHFPTEAEMVTDRSLSNSSDLHGLFCLYPALHQPQIRFSFLCCIHSKSQQGQVQSCRQPERRRGLMGNHRPQSHKRVAHHGYFWQPCRLRSC
jgi:hypothetical protein